MKFEALVAACSATPANALKYAEPLTEAMHKYGIVSQRQKAMFLAQCAIESAYLSAVEEGLYYKDATYLASIFKTAFKRSPALAAPYTRNPKALSQKLYNGYHGRGLIQLTWLDNYEAYKRHSGIDVVENPNLLLTPRYAADSAAWYFTRKTDCLTPAEQGNVEAVTLLINGKAMLHLNERKKQYVEAMKVAL